MLSGREKYHSWDSLRLNSGRCHSHRVCVNGTLWGCVILQPTSPTMAALLVLGSTLTWASMLKSENVQFFLQTVVHDNRDEPAQPPSLTLLSSLGMGCTTDKLPPSLYGLACGKFSGKSIMNGNACCHHPFYFVSRWEVCSFESGSEM